MVQSNMNNRNFLILMESIKCRGLIQGLIHQTHLFICAICKVGLINQAPTDDIMTEGI